MLTVRSKKKYHFLKYRIFLRNDSILMKFLVEIRTDYKFFFVHIFKSIGLVWIKLRPKIHFFTFWKTSKNTYMTRKIHPLNYRHSDQTISLESYRFQTAWGGLSMFWSFWDKSSKWNYPQVGGRGSENLVGLNFWPLFVTKNGILCFSAFGLIKWWWIKSSKWNYPQVGGRGSKNLVGLNFDPFL